MFAFRRKRNKPHSNGDDLLILLLKKQTAAVACVFITSTDRTSTFTKIHLKNAVVLDWTGEWYTSLGGSLFHKAVWDNW